MNLLARQATFRSKHLYDFLKFQDLYLLKSNEPSIGTQKKAAKEEKLSTPLSKVEESIEQDSGKIKNVTELLQSSSEEVKEDTKEKVDELDLVQVS